MPVPAEPPPERESLADSLYRLYALWIISSLLLALLVIVLALLGAGRMRQHARAMSEQVQVVGQLRADLAQLQRELAQLRAAPVITAVPPPAPPVSATTQPPEAVRPAETRESAADEAILALLDAALQPNEETGYELGDADLADQALREGLDHSDDEPWSGETWARLALVARLLDRDGPADEFASKAVTAGTFPREYYELSARRMLAQGRPTEAIVLADRVFDEHPGNPRAALLLGEAYCAQQDLAAADLVLQPIGTGPELTLSGKLRLGRLLVELERWDRLALLLRTLTQVRQADPTELNFLRAVSACQQNRLPEALAILDNLLAEHPSNYDFQTWRGATLLAARQFQAAREALEVANTHPERPQAWYWRGLLEVRAGSPDEAIPFFEKALAASQRHAPTWEALGALALNRGDLPEAMQNLEAAVQANPRRASAHFMIAIIHAKTLRPTATADALRLALDLDPGLLEQARQTEVIRRLFTDDELKVLAGGPGASAPPPEDTDPEQTEP
jgi:tetratricopeptide (TPR) repeat protein